LKEILVANLHVARIILTPSLPISPIMVHYRSTQKTDLGRALYANSITLTPGTITVSLSVFGDYVVHAIDDASAAPLPGEMEERVATVFGEDHD